jgi:HlyD family secretion protein
MADIRTMERKKLIKIIVILVVLGIAFYYAATYTISYLNRDKLYASGTIEAVEIEVASKVQGRVASFSVDEGDIVVKGDIIASLESDELSATLDQAVAIEKNAQIKLDNNKKTFDRAAKLKKKRMISDQEYDTIKGAYDSAFADLTRATAARKLAQIAFNEGTIKAPISGTILTKVADTGDLMAPFSTVVTMADLSVLDIILYVPETKYGKIMLKDYVYITVDSYPGESFTGRVSNISNKAEFTPKNIQTKEERTTQVFGIKVKIPNSEDKLKPGMPADAIIYLNSR